MCLLAGRREDCVRNSGAITAMSALPIPTRVMPLILSLSIIAAELIELRKDT